MKRIFILGFLPTLLVLCAARFGETNLVGPPIGLEWGMTYSEAKSVLKGKGVNIKNLKYRKKFKLPKGFKVAEVGKYKVLGRGTDVNLACFNADGELCAFQINLKFGSSELADAQRKARRYWNKELRKAIVGKYSGEGFKEHKEPDPDGNVPEIGFRDEVGNEVAVYFQSRKDLIGGSGFITIYYSNEEIIKATRAQQKSTDDI